MGIKYCISTDIESSDGHCLTRAIAFSDYCTYHHVKALEGKLKVAVEAALAYQKLSVCYRVGKQPTEKLFKELEKAAKRLTEIRYFTWMNKRKLKE